MTTLLILFAFFACAVLVTIGCAIVAGQCLKNDLGAVVSGGLLVPSAILSGLFYWLATMEVDDAPPGMVILGALTMLAAVAPITFLTSFITVRIARISRERRN